VQVSGQQVRLDQGVCLGTTVGRPQMLDLGNEGGGKYSQGLSSPLTLSWGVCVSPRPSSSLLSAPLPGWSLCQSPPAPILPACGLPGGGGCAEWAPCSWPHPPLGVTLGQAQAARCLKGPAPREKGVSGQPVCQAPPTPEVGNLELGGRGAA
jgi:hypothetical protein